MSQRGRVQKVPTVRTELIPLPNSEEAGFTHDGKQLWQQPRRMNRKVPNIEADVHPLCGVDDRGNAKHTWNDDGYDFPVCTVCKTTGKRRYTTHSQTGENIVARFRPNVVNEVRLYYLEDCGNCSVAVIDYVRPTDADLAAEKRTADFAKMGGGALGKAFVDADVSLEEAADLIRKLRDLKDAPEVQVPHVPDDQPEVVVTTGSFDDQAEEFTVPEAPVVESPKEPEVQYPVYMPVGKWRLSNQEIVECRKPEALELEAVLQAERDQAAKESAEAAEGSY